MKKKILAAIAAGLICVSAVGCGTSYQEAENTHTDKGFGNGYFVQISNWSDTKAFYYIIYDKITKVKYFVVWGAFSDRATMVPLYNADGTLQVYDGE